MTFFESDSQSSGVAQGPPICSVVVPVFRNEATLPDLLAKLAARAASDPFEVVFVIDGSPDNSYALLKTRLPGMPFPSQLICLSRNFGSFAAIRCGLEYARGQYIAFLAADLQQPVDSVDEFFRAMKRGADIAIGQRSERNDPLLSRATSAAFWALYRRFIQRDVPPGGVDAFGCTRQVRDVLVGLPEANSTLVGLLFWVGFKREFFSYVRAGRPSGLSGWTLARKLRYAFDSAFAFSDIPITLMILVGALGLGATTVVSVTVLAAWAMGAIPVQGYTALMLTLLGSVSLIILAIGLLGGYIWRVFENTKGRPPHLVRTIETIDRTASAAKQA